MRSIFKLLFSIAIVVVLTNSFLATAQAVAVPNFPPPPTTPPPTTPPPSTPPPATPPPTTPPPTTPPPAATPPYVPPELPINTGLPIPNPVPVSGEEGQGPAALIANFYSFAFLLAGFLAFVMIVYGGVRYTFSGGSSAAKEEAKDAIQQALLGLGLLLVAYLILRTINPDLTNLRLPTLSKYNPPIPPPGDPADRSGYGCEAAVITPGALICGNTIDCSDLKDPTTGESFCVPGTCSQQTACLPPPLSTECASGSCVPITGYAIKNGGLADPRMVQVLDCMLSKTPLAMRITEAMPTSSPHQSSCHNNGCCVDMTLRSEDRNDCGGVNEMMFAARECGATRVLNEYFAPDSTCGGVNTEHSSGVHLHIAAC